MLNGVVINPKLDTMFSCFYYVCAYVIGLRIAIAGWFPCAVQKFTGHWKCIQLGEFLQCPWQLSGGGANIYHLSSNCSRSVYSALIGNQ